MKRVGILLLVAAIVLGCASTNGTPNDTNTESNAGRSLDNNAAVSSEGGNTDTVNLSSVINIQWNLIEVYIDGTDTQFRRAYQPAVQNDLFILTFNGEMLSGVGAPNRFSAPYKMGEDQTISVMLVRSTLMAALFEPVNLREHDFFTYIQNAYKWQLVNGNLELLSITESDLPVRMVFMVYR